MSADRTALAAARFAALGDETRLSLVAKLSRGEPLSISRLTEGGGVTRQAVTKHLTVLEEAGLVRGIRHGREKRFELRSHAIVEARRALDRIAREWEGALARLKAFAEE